MDREHDVPPSESREIKLTALALGELSEAEAAQLLAESADPAADLQAAAELALLGEQLRQAWRSESFPVASPALRQALASKFDEAPAAPLLLPSRGRWPARRFWLPYSLAASVLVMGGVAIALKNIRHTDQRVAQSERRRGLDDRVRLLSSTDESTVESLVQSPTTTNLGRGDRAEPSSNIAGVTDFDGNDLMDGKVAAGEAPVQDITEFTISEAAGAAGPPVRLRTTDLYDNVSGMNERSNRKMWRPNAAIPAPREPNVGLETQPDMPGSGTIRNVNGQPPAPTAHFYSGPPNAANGQMKGMMGGMGGMPPMAGGAPMPGALGMQAGAQNPAQEEAREAQRRNFAAEGLGAEALNRPSAESYAPIVENPFLRVSDAPLSTFSIDVDTASYANVRRYLNSHLMPPPNAVRIEEFVNYFRFDYPQPEGEAPFSVTTEVAGCPWKAEHRLLRIGLHGREIAAERRPAGNLAFLVDVSGSMDQPNKLPLVKESLLLLTEQLDERDHVSIVTYAGNSGLALAPTSGGDKRTIETAISGLAAGGSTNGGEGIQAAYAAAQANFVKGGANRVILATDGDFNVGITDQSELVKLIEDKARGGVYFTALGFGSDNLKDDTLEKLADRGNGNYAYIDNLGEARKVLVEQLAGTLVTIAKDVKLQLEFNPAQVESYRLIGYENRVLANADFHDDRKDAGEVGAGHTVTALYELNPAGGDAPAAAGDELKYQRRAPALKAAADSGGLLTLKLRYKQPDGETSRLFEHVVTDPGKKYGQAGVDFKFAASVAAFGMLLRGSPHAGGITYDAVLELAREGRGSDLQGDRAEFIELIEKAKAIAPAP